jgi:hypothetical protein
MPDDEKTPEQVAGTPAAAPERRPSSVRLQDELLQVMVDQWGHRGEYTRGMIVRRSSINAAHYDVDSALMRGVVRRLTEAEARPESLPLTTALDDNGEVDLDHARAMQFHAGIPPEAPRTVTVGQGPPEPAEFSKDASNAAPAARPIVEVGSVEEVDAAARPPEIVATPAGPAFAAPQETNGGGNRPSASELAAQARQARSAAELEAVEAQADARMTTVHDAVAQRRAELAQEG